MIWYFWDFGWILGSAALGFACWSMIRNVPGKTIDPYLAGLSVAFMSAFSVGLFVAVSLAFYVSFVKLYELLIKLRG